jgi:hypothetical protein
VHSSQTWLEFRPVSPESNHHQRENNKNNNLFEGIVIGM